MGRTETCAVAALTRFRRHEHESVHFCAVLDGGFTERVGRSWHDVGPHRIRVSGACRHDIDFGRSGARCVVGELDADHALRARLRRAHFVETDAWLAQIIDRLSRMDAGTDAAAGVLGENLITELVAQLERRIAGRRTAPPPWLQRLREQIEDMNGCVRISELARTAGVHRVHVARSFHEHCGVPITVYARRVRLATAYRLLTSASLSVAQIAARTGFSDQSHLTRVMHSTMQQTPGALRKSMLHPFKT